MTDPLEMACFRLADRQHKSVGFIKRTTGSAELHTWVEFFRIQQTEKSKNDWYMAQLAMLLYSILRVLTGVFSKKPIPPKTDITDFMVQFEKGAEEKRELGTQVWDDERVKRSKAAWFAAAGVGIDGEVSHGT